MKYYFPPKNQGYTYLQTNRSDDLGSLWSSFNLDFQSNFGTMRLGQKLVTITTSSDDADLGLPTAFEYAFNKWWAICGTRMFRGGDVPTDGFTEDTTSAWSVGLSDTQFDVTNPGGNVFRYTYDGTGTDPNITALTFPIGATVSIVNTNMAASNEGTALTVTGSGANYFEITRAGGTVESNKTIGPGYISVLGGTLVRDFSINCSDLAIFNMEGTSPAGKLFATTDTGLYSKGSDTSLTSTGSWIKRDNFTTASSHKMAFFKKFNRLYYVYDTSSIRSIDTDGLVASSGDYFIDLDGTESGFVTTIVSNSSFVWIGSMRVDEQASISESSIAGTQATISQWDGISAQITNEFPIQASGVLAMTVLNDVPYAIDTEGRVLKYTGYSFEEVGRLPIDRILLYQSGTYKPTLGRFIHMNGFVATKNNTLQVLVNNLTEDGSTPIENFPSGIWEIDLDSRNFTHRYSSTLKSLSSSTTTDYGQNLISSAGALKLNNFPKNDTAGRVSLLAGFAYFTDNSTTKYGIFLDTPVDPSTNNEGQKRGYFVTTWFNTEEMVDKFERLWAKFRRLQGANDFLSFKYRLEEEEPVQASITWTSTTTFTTTTDVSAYGPTATGFNGTTGGEVEVLQGTGSGSCTHISSIVNNAGTYTVTLDTAVPNVGTSTAKARFQKWIKIFNAQEPAQIISYLQGGIGANNVRIQIKGCLGFTGNGEFYQMAVFSNEDIKITA